MLRDNCFFVKITLPALASTNTATLKMSKLGIPKCAHQQLRAVLFGTLTNGALSTVKDSAGDWCIRITASGTIAANTVCNVFCQMAPEVAMTLTKDA